MSNYTKTVDFAAKDTLPSGDSGKIIKGTEFETEFDNISTAIATKADSAAPTFTGTSVFTNLDINGTVQADGAVTVGVDDTGYDVKFFGATTGKSLLWDESADTLIVTGDSTVSGTLGVTGVLTATSLDISGDIDVDGTTNLDVVDIDGAVDMASTLGVTGVATLASLVATTADINGGTIDGVTIGGSSAGDITYANLSDGTITITAFADEDDMVSNSATLVPTQQSVKAYVDAQVTAQDLDIVGDTGTDSIDLDSETITFTGGTGITSVVTTGTVTHNIDSTVATLTGSQTLTNKSLTAPTLTGTAIVASLDISGDIDVDGTTNLDVVDIDGAVDFASTTAHAGNATFADNAKAIFGAGSDLQIYHDPAGPSSVISDQGAGDLILRGSNQIRFQDATGAEHYAIFNENGAVQLFYANAAQLATTNTGIDVTGTVTADGLTVDGTVDVNFGSDGSNIASLSGASAGRKLDIQSFAVGASAGAGYSINATSGQGELDFQTTGTSRLNIDAGGDISFYEDTGMTPKLAWSAANERLTLTGSDYQFGIQQGANQPWYSRAVSDGTFRLHLNGTGDVLTADTSGNVDVTGTVTADGLEIATSVADTGVDLTLNGNKSTNGGIGSIIFENAGDSVGMIRSNRASANDAADMLFYTQATGGANTQRMRIDSSGFVGIGTTSPQGPLHVYGGEYAYIGPNVAGVTPDSTTGGIAIGWNKSSGQGESIIAFNKGAGATGGLVFADNNGGTYAERMRIDASGNLLVGKTDTTFGTVGVENRSDGRITSTRSGNTNLLLNRLSSDGDIVQFYKDGTTVGSISVTASATAYNTSSDQRLKENIADADDAGSKIDAIQVRKFDWKADGSHQDYGMVAQELLEVAPEAVSGDPESDDMMGVDYSKLVPMMLKEIQSLRARVAQLES